MAEVTGGEIIARMLEAEGVERFFGIMDGTYLELCKAMVAHDIELVTPRHETTAAHMAGAYARFSGKLGVCIASNGPGVANILSGVAVENAEGNRVLLITSSRRPQISNPDRGGAYQCFDQIGVIGAMSKWSGTAATFDRIPEQLRRALRHCYQGRPGVVHLDIPETLMNGKTEEPSLPLPHQYRRVDPIPASPGQVAAAARLLRDARLPIIHAGSGVIHCGAFEELGLLARLLHAPVTTSWCARGVLPETSELAWPMHMIEAVNSVRNASDCVLVLGSRLGETDWWGKAPYWAQPDEQRLIHVDIDEQVLGQNRPADLAVQADARLFLQALVTELQRTGEVGDVAARRKEAFDLSRDKEAFQAKLDEKLDDREAPMLTAHVGAVCREVFDNDAVAVFDGGNTAVWGNFYHQARVPNTQISTHHMGHLGAGLGQALGAAVARPDRQVYCIIGDGAFGFHPQEIETAVRHGLKVIWLVVCDRQWGMVKMTQSMAARPLKMILLKSLDPEETINADLGEVAWDQVARAMGAHGERVSHPDELRPALERCLAADNAAVVHVDVDPKKHMWAPGLMYFKDMHQEPEG